MQKNLLFISGPVAVSEPVLAAMAKPLINHRGPNTRACSTASRNACNRSSQRQAMSC
jgi:aspartate aminotransferase-like enzyme